MIYVVDTSVILSDPKALERMSDRHVVIPLAVLDELEGKRNHPELGYSARSGLRYLEDYRKRGELLSGLDTPDGGSIRVEVNHVSTSNLHTSFQDDRNDNRILAVAANLAAEGLDVVLMTNDLPLRLKAAVTGLQAEEYDADAVRPRTESVQEIQVDWEVVDALYDDGEIDAGDLGEFPTNTMFILRGGTSSVLCRKGPDNMLRKIYTAEPCGLKAKSARQHFALDLLTDPDVGIVSLGGQAGSGKTVMALAAAVEGLNDRSSTYDKIMVFRPIQAVGDQELGFLPGTQEEKMAPWAEAVYDAMESFLKYSDLKNAKQRVEVLPLTHIRGRTLKNTYVIIDEAQNLDLMTLVTALTRIGEGSKVVLTHDVSQRDNLRVGKHDGIAKVVSNLSGSPLFGHVTLNKSERSAIAQLVAGAFDL